ncbi:glycine zipper family protein [Vibrio sp. SCSIO 43135]|uniref:glycine zipper family protein n=1 Tax=Vibrio sp. SCSIO 43135 TaxID=2819096 RepID=UPI0020764935|nr:glycine zipper family protein [Vibrio sp. SCSIO 43135]USD43167.1 glycine zipper family protein [Vibrio sp. SCSIO 43135]
MLKYIPIAFTSLALTACAYNQQPVVDMTNVDPVQYEQDFNYCQGYAENVDKGEAAKVGAENSAIGGAAMGAVLGAIDSGIGGAVVGAAAGGAVGAGAGALGGSEEATKTQALVLRQCLSHKGYTVYDLES